MGVNDVLGYNFVARRSSVTIVAALESPCKARKFALLVFFEWVTRGARYGGEDVVDERGL